MNDTPFYLQHCLHAHQTAQPLGLLHEPRAVDETIEPRLRQTRKAKLAAQQRA